jgi:tetratricopeptide (TPR) repeat protein
MALMPRDPVPCFLLGRLLTHAGDRQRASELLRKAEALDPGFYQAPEALADNLIQEGKSKTGSGDRDGALAVFGQAEAAARRSIAINPEPPWADLNLGASLMERYRLLGAPSKALVEEAIREYDKVLSAPTKKHLYTSALTDLCDALIQSRSLERALTVCRQVTELEPQASDGFYNLAAVHALAGRRAEALAALDKDVDLGDTEVSYLLGDA